MSEQDYRFWREKGHLHLRPGSAPFPGGFDLLGVIHDELGECRRVLEVGCGDGRLSEAFVKGQYLGLDVNEENINNARHKHRQHMFRLCEYDLFAYPDADAILVIHVLLHVPDDEIGVMIERLTLAAPIILVGEILGREWRREGEPPAYSRDLDDYLDLFAEAGCRLRQHQRYPYAWYMKQHQHEGKNRHMSILRFERLR
jgi:SAM-dependent methyltransferase